MVYVGRLESENSVEYENVAAFAKELGMQEFLDDLLNVARVEVEHKVFFLRSGRAPLAFADDEALFPLELR